ncbi:MAG: helix-turn-helix domain-containing protein [Erysipelotrichaceae bacterium]|nr:helix-turn-helix domain-containing protein [Erysipelotrichaceae bacterium]MDY5252378.1 helix-turn-helix domain-containing protein [Erysipelotrichaceae bacterium]
MKIKKKRIWRILYLLADSNRIMTASELGKLVGVSQRTIKSDIKEIAELALSCGCKLVTHKACGYSLHVVDRETFDEIVSLLNTNFSDHEYCENFDSKANEITRHLLMKNHFIKEEDLADEMFISLSTLKSNINNVKSIIQKFNLSYESKKNEGIRIDGLELNKRFCMLELLLKHHFNAIPLIDFPEFEALFELNNPSLSEIRQVILKQLRENNVHIIDSNMHRIVRYIALMYKRYDLGYTVDVESSIIYVCERLEEFKLSLRIVHELNRKYGLSTLDYKEVVGLTILFLYYIDVSLEDNLLDKYGPEIYFLANDFRLKVLNKIRIETNIDFNIMANEQLLNALFIPYAFRYKFKDISYNLYLGRNINNNDISLSPLMIVVASIGRQFLISHLEIEFNDFFIYEFASRLYYLMMNVHYDYRKRNIIIVMRNGINSGLITRDKLLSTFGADKFNRIDIMEFYEVRGKNQKNYDCVLLNSDPFYYKNYQVPAIICNTILTRDQLREINTKVIQKGYCMNEVLEKLDMNEKLKVETLSINNNQELFSMLKFRFGYDEKQNKKIINLYSNDQFIVNDTLSIMIDSQLCKENFLEIYHLDKPFIWKKQSVFSIIVFSINFNYDLCKVKLMQQILEILVNDSAFLKSIDSSFTVQDLVNKIMMECIN